ncbi:ABC transporter substrate-binding protein [Nocardioides sp. Root140]|nr:ABC transporter substrate-binding protein [Nocardioides sp. Root140]
MMTRYRTAFAERNKVVLALVGITAMVLVFLCAFYAEALPGLRGRTYTAQFAEAGGIRPGNEVRVAGVMVGEVTDVSLDGKVVEVEFRVKDVDLGSESTASIKVKTMLGQKFLSIDPLGSGELDEPIPVERTTVPYDVNAAFSDLSTTVDEIDTEQLEKSFQVLSDTFRNTPQSVRSIVTGLTDLSRTLSSRDAELAGLMQSASSVTGTLADRNAEFAKIITDGSALLGELETRRQTVKDLLTGTTALGTQLRGLVKDNEKTLSPALAKLDKVSEILNRNQQNLEAAMSRLGPYYRVLASATGSGRWIDSYICGLFDASQAPLLDNDVERNCSPATGGGR